MGKLKKWFSIRKNKDARLIILIWIILFNIFLWLASSVLAYLLDRDSFASFFNAFWESGITWMLDPGFYDPNSITPIRILALVVIVISMITFSGGIIGYVASLFSSIIENAEKGKSKLYVYDHILILNWNPKALELIYDYAYDDRVTDVVVLSEFEKVDIERQVQNKFYEANLQRKFKKKINVLIKKGDVLSKSDLCGVCIDKAKTIIILAKENIDNNYDLQDLQAIKSVMLVANLELKENQKIIVEVKKEETVAMINDKIIKTLKLENRLIPVVPDQMMGFLIAETLLFPDLSNVYEELFSFSGAEFYATKETPVEEFLKTHNKAIPIYNYDGSLFVMSDVEKNIDSIRDEPITSCKPIKIKKGNVRKDKTLLIFGNNNKLKYILSALKSYEIDSGSKLNITLVKNNDAKSINEAINGIKKIDSILILSNESKNGDELDSDVILTLLLIQDLAKLHKADIIIELLDVKNYGIAKSYNIRNTIISNKYISRIMTQLSKNIGLYHLFMDLLTFDDDNSNETYEIYTYTVENMLESGENLHFDSASELINSSYFSSNGNFIVIGTVINKEVRIFKGDLDKLESIDLKKDDMLISITK